MTTRKRKNLLTGLLFASPWIIGMLVFIVIPFFLSFYYSFTNYSLLEQPRFIGFDNFRYLFTDEVVWIALKNTLILAVITVPLSMIAALVVSLVLQNQVKGSTFFKALVYTPHILPVVVVALIWRWIFNGEYGLVNTALRILHLPEPPWLSNPHWMMSVFIIIRIFLIGQLIILFLAALQGVPKELYEVAYIDGAGWWSCAIHITLPMISPIIQFNFIMQLIALFQTFAIPYILTSFAAGPSGGPGRASTFLITYIYELAFTKFTMGRSCALAWMVFLILLVLTWLALRIGRKWVFHFGEE